MPTVLSSRTSPHRPTTSRSPLRAVVAWCGALAATAGLVLGGGTAAVASSSTAPFGAVDSVRATATGVTVSGWALDPDTSEPVAVHVYVGGTGAAVRADRSRPDVAAAHGRGDRHGYEATIAAAPGRHSVCVYAINDRPGVNAALGCREVTVGNAAPFGAVDTVRATATGVTVSGWALDPDTSEPVAVHVYVGGTGAAVRADRSRPDVAAAFGRGDRHGYEATIAAAPGRHSVCVYAINDRPGANAALGCREVSVGNAAPIGAVDAVTTATGGVSVSGWALDPDTSASIPVHVYVGSASAAVTADGVRPDVAAVHRRGDRHGYTASVTVGAGRHQVCVYAINDRPGTNPLLGCRTVTVSTKNASTSGPAGARDPWLHPFASSSIWNTAIGSRAAFEPANGSRTSSLHTAKPVINRDQWSIPVRHASTRDPLVTLQSVRTKQSYRIHIPADTVTTGGLDGHVTIVSPDGITSYDTFKLVKVNAGLWQAQVVTVVDLRTSGIWAGVRAAATPALAGLIRAHELDEKHIPHALAIAAPNTVLKNGPVWPAKRQDADGATSYSGRVPMGSMFAIPASVDVEALRISPEGKALARALQDYGAYVVDRAGSAALYCELACDPTATARMNADWKVLFKHVRAVTNSTQSTVGGGGSPRVAAAAGF